MKVCQLKVLIGSGIALVLLLATLLSILIVESISIEGRTPTTSIDVAGKYGTSRVVKKTFSDRMRLFFMVGLEGTGHHYLYAALGKMFKTHEEFTRIDRCNFTNPYDIAKYLRNTSKYLEDIQRARNEMHEMTMLETTLPPGGGMLIYQGCKENWVGMQSFPNYHGRNKALQYPDVRMLAEVAEAEGVDLRVIFLKRDAEQILGSGTRRGFHR